MDRPPRKTKMVNYCDSQNFGDDDDDFSSSTKAPPRKKAREELKQQKKKSSSKYSSQEDSDSQSKIRSQDRKPLVEKVFERDLEAALTLSLLHSSDGKEDQSPNVTDVECPTQEDENVPPSVQHISNCSVNIAVLGLEQITAEQRSHCAPSRQRKAACSAQEPHRAKSKDGDEDYLPKMTPDTDSDDDFSDAPDSEDEEFTVKKVNKTGIVLSKKDKKTKAEKTQASPKTLSKKDKQPSKSSTSHTAVSQAGRSLPPTKISQPDRSPPPLTKISQPDRCPPPTKISQPDISPPPLTKISQPDISPPPLTTKISRDRSPPPLTKMSQPDRSPPQTKTTSTSKRPAISGSTPASHPLSPAGGGRVPKWTPPGQVGKSPGSSQTVPGRSPGQGLRLGLSRRVRVKPLHPSVTSH